MGKISREAQNPRLRSNGRIPAPYKQVFTPSLLMTCRWLLHLPDNCTEANIVTRARLCGLIKMRGKDYWGSDGTVLECLVKRAIRRIPKDPTIIGHILYGLGELDARCHCQVKDIIQSDMLHALRRWDGVSKALDGLNKALLNGGRKTASVSEISLAQTLKRAPLESKTIQWAVSALQSPYNLGVRALWGVRFSIPILIQANPASVEKWMQKSHDAPALANIVRGLAETLMMKNEQGLAEQLLAMEIPLLKSLGSAWFLANGEVNGQTKSYKNHHKCFHSKGIGHGDALWICAVVFLKECIHERYRRSHRLREAEQSYEIQCRNFEENVNISPANGLENADVQQRQQQLEACEHQLEAILADMAECWPEEGLDEHQMTQLQEAFVDTTEIRYRLAIKLEHQENRNHLLDINLRQLKQWLGTKDDAGSIFDKHFHVRADDLERKLEWGAKSHVARYENDKRGIGHRASDTVHSLTESAEKILEEPFIAARQPERYRSAVERTACGLLFALNVMSATPEDRQPEVARLRELAIEHTVTLLRSIRGDALPRNSTVDQLVNTAIYWMRKNKDCQKMCVGWAENNRLPDYARAMAAWSSPDGIDEHGPAPKLFKEIAHKPLSRFRFQLRLNRLVSLLDLAIYSAWQKCSEKEYKLLESLWSDAYEDWGGILGGKLKFLPATLWKALQKDGPERQEVLRKRGFCNSYITGRIRQGKIEKADS